MNDTTAPAAHTAPWAGAPEQVSQLFVVGRLRGEQCDEALLLGGRQQSGEADRIRNVQVPPLRLRPAGGSVCDSESQRKG